MDFGELSRAGHRSGTDKDCFSSVFICVHLWQKLWPRRRRRRGGAADGGGGAADGSRFFKPWRPRVRGGIAGGGVVEDSTARRLIAAAILLPIDRERL